MTTENPTVRPTRTPAARPPRSDRPASERLRKQVKKVTKDLAELNGAARDAILEKTEQLGGNVSERFDEGRQTMQHAGRSFEEFVRARPFKSVLIAAGVGLLFGRFWSRR